MNKARGPKNVKKALKGLCSYLKKYNLLLLIVFLCIILSVGAGIIGSIFLQTLIDDHIAPMIGSENPDFHALAVAIIKMAVIYLVGIAACYTYELIMVVIAQGVLKNIRDDMFIHMQSLPVKYFDSNTTGDVMSHYTNDADALFDLLAHSIPQCLSSVMTVVGVTAAMIVLNLWMTIVVAVTVVMMMFVTKKMGGKSAKYFMAAQNSIAHVNGYVEEMVSGQKVVKVFNHESEAIEAFEKINTDHCANTTNAHKISNMFMPVMANLGRLQYVLIAIIGGVMAINGFGGVTLGLIASFMELSKSFNRPVNIMAQQINSVVMALAGLERILELTEEKPESDEGTITLANMSREAGGSLRECEEKTGIWAWKSIDTETGETTYIPLKGDIRMNDVDFSYVDGKQVLFDISLYAKPGQKIAFVGSTGAGKTTITNLLNRFYDIQSGHITYDGIDIMNIKKASLRSSMAIVLQETHLFTGTVMENIRYGRLDATDEEVIAAAKLVNADEFIMRLPEGYNTMLTGNAANLSQGQRQLITIARAAVADPPVMILDEATSSVDTRTEAILQDGMDRLMSGRTVFVIAHRLSTVRNADAIMVLEHGKIIERGTHEELLNMKGQYYKLYTGVFELS